MAFMDEEILKGKRDLEEAKKKYESEKNLEAEAESSIYDEQVMIMGKPVRFERRKIEDINLSIMMPTDFSRISSEMTRLIFPAGNPPTHFYACGDIQFQITLNRTGQTLANDKIPEFLKLSEKMIKAVGPRANIVDRKNVETENLKIGVLSFVTAAIDMPVFNYQFYISIDDSLIIGSILFPSKFKKRFMKIAEEVIMSLRKEGENESDNLS